MTTKRTTGDYAFELIAPHALAERFESLLRPLAVVSGSVDERIVVRPTDQQGLSITFAHRRPLATPSTTHAIRRVLSHLTRRSFDLRPDRLHLHAGVVGLPAGAVLIHGARGSGKSTTVASLLEPGGATYGSDESVGIDPTTGTAHSWPKPILLRPAGADALGLHQLDGDEHTVPYCPWEGGRPIGTEFRPRLIVGIRYEAGVRTRVQPLHPCDAAVGLAANTFDLPRFEPRGLLTLCRLTSQVSSYEIVHGLPPAEIAALVRRLVQRHGLRYPAPEVIPPRRADTGLGHGPRVEAVRVGDQLAAHSYAQRVAVSFDGPATELWQRIDGRISAEQLAGDPPDPGVADFLERLAAVGLTTTRD